MSMPRRSTMTTTLMLGLVCLAMAGAVYWEAGSRSRVPAVPPSAESGSAEDTAIPDDPERQVPPREQFVEVVLRPLFSPTRRPAEQAEEVAAPESSQPLDIDLLGVVIWRSQRLALVRARNEENVVQVAVGGTISGWTVVVIEPNRVMFRQGESQQELRLAYKTGGSVEASQ